MTLSFNPDDYEFYKLLDTKKSGTNKPKPAQPVTIPAITSDSRHGSRYGQVALASELETLRHAVEGTRNDTLNKACFSLSQIVAAGHLDRDHVYTELYHTALGIGLTETETRATMASAYGAGSLQPRDIKPTETLAPAVTLLPTPSHGSDGPADIHVGGPDNMVQAVSGVHQYDTPNDVLDQVEERTSWWPRNIEDAITGINTEPEPNILGRDDGTFMFYAGKVNGIIGESESGKTWIALQAAVEQAHAGRNVTYIDFEDTDTGVIGRLKTLGLSEDHIRAHIAYISPDEALNISAASDLQEHVNTHQPSLIVIDGMNAAMTLLDLDLMSNQDTTKFAQLLLFPLARSGAAVCFIDHTPKSGGETKGGIGAQAKRAMTTGCTLKAEVIEPFGRGQNGRLELWVDKDRPGHVRGNSMTRNGGHHAAVVDIQSNTIDDQVRITIQSPHPKPGAEHKPFEPTHLMEQVSKLLEEMNGQPVSARSIRDSIKGKTEYLTQAINQLAEQGYIKREPGARNSIMHTLLKPYRDPTKPQPVTVLDPPPKQAKPKTQIMTSTGQIVDPTTGEMLSG